jgi:hypothetical protein
MLNRQTLMTALPIAAAVLLMGVSCYYQGVWSERWGEFPELQIYSDQLKEIPKNIGEWRMEKEEQTDERILKLAGAAGELSRTYRNASGEEVRMMMMCARFRDVFYHTPERCYPAAGFEMQSEPQHVVFDIAGKEAQFFSTTFVKQEATGSHGERGYWSWTENGTWLAPTNEKVTFAGARAMYKLYVFGNIPVGNSTRDENDFCSDLMRAFLPGDNTALRPAID